MLKTPAVQSFAARFCACVLALPVVAAQAQSLDASVQVEQKINQDAARSQVEAAKAIGLKDVQVLRLVVFPQALRVIIPPLTGHYLNLTKNSSLAVAIGYPDLFSVSGTILNQSGRAVEVISLTMAVYLGLSLLTSWIMNWYNQRMKLIER